MNERYLLCTGANFWIGSDCFVVVDGRRPDSCLFMGYLAEKRDVQTAANRIREHAPRVACAFAAACDAFAGSEACQSDGASELFWLPFRRILCSNKHLCFLRPRPLYMIYSFDSVEVLNMYKRVTRANARLSFAGAVPISSSRQSLWGNWYFRYVVRLPIFCRHFVAIAKPVVVSSHRCYVAVAGDPLAGTPTFTVLRKVLYSNLRAERITF